MSGRASRNECSRTMRRNEIGVSFSRGASVRADALTPAMDWRRTTMRWSVATRSPMTEDAVGKLPAPVPANVSEPELRPMMRMQFLRAQRLREGVLGAHVGRRDDRTVDARAGDELDRHAQALGQ